MKPGPDLKLDYKRLVALGYDSCAETYETARRDTRHPELTWLKNQLPNRAHALDIGCGAGLPVSRDLAKRFAVTGVDISGEQIRRARQNVPHATFIHSDIMAVDFPVASFDVVVSFFAIFHLPRGEHARLFQNIARWLKPGGYFMASLADGEEECSIEKDFHGVEMYWSYFDMASYRAMLQNAGFEIVRTSILGHGYSEPAPEESHPLVVARRTTGNGYG